jgi:hypothetical protein
VYLDDLKEIFHCDRAMDIHGLQDGAHLQRKLLFIPPPPKILYCLTDNVAHLQMVSRHLVQSSEPGWRGRDDVSALAPVPR